MNHSTNPIRGPVLPLFALLLGYVGSRGTILWEEYRALRDDWQKDQEGRAVGYPGVVPIYSQAAEPNDWLHDDGNSTLLWAGWDRIAKQHNWFVVSKGEITMEHLSHPMGRDAIRAIDKPKVESRTGEVWNSMPPRTTVAAGEFQGIPLAYPIAVLNKVLVVNDEIHKRPFLVVFTPFVGDVHAVEMFNPIVDGTSRRTLGNAGYLWDKRPLLYDHESMSLWITNEKGLSAIAGPDRGKIMSRIARMEPVEWQAWSGSHRDGRLVAEAIRADLKPDRP